MNQEFEKFIIKCCEMDEWDLRDFLRTKLRDAGFTIQEDNYKSPRRGKYQQVHNMLAIRGTKPKVCLVAHTDVCRDHNIERSGHRKAEPVIKKHEYTGERIIQDKNCRVQVGGDDRLGVAINTWIALNTGYDMGLCYCTDEEIGTISSDYMHFKELGDFELLCQVDRGNHSDQLVTNIYGLEICSPATATKLLKIAKEMGKPRDAVRGMLTDVYAIKSNRRCRDAVNMTCGYHGSCGSSPSEYIKIDEALDTMIYVNQIIKQYELETIADIENPEQKQADKDKEIQQIIELQKQDDMSLEINSLFAELSDEEKLILMNIEKYEVFDSQY